MNWFSWWPRALHSNQHRMLVKIVYSQSYVRIDSFWPIRTEDISSRWPASCSSSSHVGLSFRRSPSNCTAVFCSGLLKFWLFVFTRLLFDPQTGTYVFTQGCRNSNLPKYQTRARLNGFLARWSPLNHAVRAGYPLGPRCSQSVNSFGG